MMRWKSFPEILAFLAISVNSLRITKVLPPAYVQQYSNVSDSLPGNKFYKLIVASSEVPGDDLSLFFQETDCKRDQDNLQAEKCPSKKDGRFFLCYFDARSHHDPNNFKLRFCKLSGESFQLSEFKVRRLALYALSRVNKQAVTRHELAIEKIVSNATIIDSGFVTDLKFLVRETTCRKVGPRVPCRFKEDKPSQLCKAVVFSAPSPMTDEVQYYAPRPWKTTEEVYHAKCKDIAT